jgi:hypothetical protein
MARPSGLFYVVLRRRLLAILIASTLLSAAPGAAQSAREQAWREDVAFFAHEFAARQLDFSKLYPRERFDRDLEALTRSIPTATDADLVLALMRLVASAHVGHTYVRAPTDGPLAFHRLPLGFQWFADGLAVTAATDPNRAALGLRVTSIGSLPPEKLEAAIAQYVAYEDDAWLHPQSQTFMVMEEVLRAAGQVDAAGHVVISLARADGTTMTLSVTPTAWNDHPPLVTAVEALHLPIGLALVESKRYYRYEILPATKTLYIRYSKCADDPQQPFAAFAKELFATVDANPSAVDRVVVDLRANGGGDSMVIKPLIDGLRARKSLSAQGKLYVLVGPATFSSGLLAAIDLRHDVNAIAVGEQPGEKLNSYGEVRPLTLPHSRLLVQYSTKYFKLLNGRQAGFEPDMTVRTTIGEWLAGRDSVLEAAIKR